MERFIVMSNDETAAFQYEHESKFIESFIVPEKRERWLLLLQGKRRASLLSSLAGWKDFASDRMEAFPKNADSENIISFLELRIRPGTRCWMMSDWTGLDKNVAFVHDAIKAVFGLGLGSVVSIIPGALAYYESELGCRFLLTR
jgi:hypothetical protein